MQTALVTCLVVVVAATTDSYGIQNRQTYLPPGPLTMPQIVMRDVVSTADPEFAFTASPDGRLVLFNRATPDRSMFHLLATQLIEGRWTPPALVPFSGRMRDPDPAFSPDGSRLFFSSNRPNGHGGSGDFDIWFVERSETWSEAVNVGDAVNTSFNEVFATIANDGTIYFASNRAGHDDLYSSRIVNGRYQPAQRLQGDVNTSGNETNPAISPDQQTLVFAASRPDGLGEADLYVSYRRDGNWSAGQNLGAAINSRWADFAPSFTPDGQSLLFTSERPGVVAKEVVGRRPGDIYAVSRSALEPRFAIAPACSWSPSPAALP